MPDLEYLSEEILLPVSPDFPAGRDLRFDPLFGKILEAKQADEATGKKTDWRTVAERSLEALRSSKDLRLCCFLTEAGIFLGGFPALRDCLRLTREMLTRFWNDGLYPLIEDGDLDYRSAPLAWFNERMADAVKQIPITAGGKGDSYGFSRYLQARQVGTEESMAKLPSEKLEWARSLLSQGWITMDAFMSSMDATPAKSFEEIYDPFREARKQFTDLIGVVGDKFGTAAPSFTEAKTLFDEMHMLLEGAFAKKHNGQNGTSTVTAIVVNTPAVPRATAGPPISVDSCSDSLSWKEAEQMVQSGKVDEGLQQLKALAALETSGRARFLRQLAFVDLCRKAGRDRLARTILEELNRKIVEHKLEAWEGTDLVGSVWSRLYRLYKSSEVDSEREQAYILYNQLCRLDPWQTYVDCED